MQTWLQIHWFSEIDDRGQWGDRPKATSCIHLCSFMQSPILVDCCEKRCLHSTPLPDPWWMRATTGDSSPIYSSSSHFRSILRALWKSLTWGIYSRVKHTWREGGHVKECATHLYDPWDWLNPFPIPQFERNTEKIKKKNSETLIEQPWVDWVKDEGIEDPVGASPTHSSVLNHTHQYLCNWIFFTERGTDIKEASWPGFRVGVLPIT